MIILILRVDRLSEQTVKIATDSLIRVTVLNGTDSKNADVATESFLGLGILSSSLLENDHFGIL
jgi:hypothetical protein